MLAIVTGATSGIGQATAVALADRGWDLIITGRRRDRLTKLQSQIKKNSPKVKVHVAAFDLQKPKSLKSFVAKHKSLLPRVELLVNNAGLAKGVEPLQEGKTEDWDQMLDTNVRGLLQLTRAVLPAMIQRSHGHIVNMGSVAGRWVYPGGGVYCATKYAVRAISEGLRMDLAGTGIRVTNIEPGRVETEFSEVRLGNRSAAKAVYEGYRPLKAEDIADCIVWAIDRPAHVNIQEIVVFPTDQASISLVKAARGVR